MNKMRFANGLTLKKSIRQIVGDAMYLRSISIRCRVCAKPPLIRAGAWDDRSPSPNDTRLGWTEDGTRSREKSIVARRHVRVIWIIVYVYVYFTREWYKSISTWLRCGGGGGGECKRTILTEKKNHFFF